MSEPDSATDGHRSYSLALKAWREQCIRRGQIEPSTPQERRWASEGPVKPSELETVRG
jgi:hypothetical protein